MSSGKVLKLYMTISDLMRAGHRTQSDLLECDPGGIVGDINYDTKMESVMLLVSKKSYEIIEEAELVLDEGVLMENIYVDIDLNHLKKGSVIEIGDMTFEVDGPCHAYDYLYRFDPELPELIKGQRGIYITPVEYGTVELGDEVKVLEEA